MMNRKMDELLYFIATLILTVVLTACGKSKSPSKEQQAADSYDYSVIETAPVYVDSFKKDSSTNASQKAKISVTPTDSYDDGYLDGEAMAEEDRLAGKPGMQVGMDDDDEDYEDGFDDGYEE
jgi:hypothetical protein